MEESTNPPQVPSNCTSPVCPDPAHDDLALDAEWSDENRDCDGDGPHRVVEDPEDLDVPDVRVHEDEDREVQQDLLRFSGAHAPEILKVSCFNFQRIDEILSVPVVHTLLLNGSGTPMKPVEPYRGRSRRGGSQCIHVHVLV